jgi:hypothetical protein
VGKYHIMLDNPAAKIFVGAKCFVWNLYGHPSVF